ncbi:MAG: hypothetical protein HPY68_08370 [Candidatus Atribacteria bacterium]|nr:hypothetical protein [Candidatus Atribacteria bacterium]
MKYLGILLVVALVFVGSVAMAANEFLLEGDSWQYPGGTLPVEILLKVTVANYYEIYIPKTILHWKINDPGLEGMYTAPVPGTIEVTSNYSIAFTFKDFKDPKHENGTETIEAWWQFLKDNTVVKDWFRAQGASPFDISIPGDGVKHTISFYSKIVIPQSPIPKAGVYTDHDLEILITPDESGA